MVAIFVLAVSALLAVPAVVAGPQTSPAHLFARQLTGIDPSQLPSTCLNTKCQAFVDSVTNKNCVTLDCLCTNDIVSAIKSCEQCALDAGITGFSQSDIDSGMAAFAQACSDAGHPISGISTSGGSGGSSSASSGGSSATGTKTGSGSTSTATTASSSSSSTGSGSSGSSGSSKSDATVMTASVLGSFVALALGAMNLV